MAKITSDPDAAIEFLKKWEPSGPWCLTAIIPDGTTETRTFDPGYNNDDLAEWLDGCEGRRNVYFSVNRPRMGLTKKALKTDIIFMLALHVDVDPDKGKDIKKERTKILKRIKKFEPKPSIVIDSGGGYQAFWLLKEPEKVTEPAALEAYNKQLELLLTADHCHNIDRIMRLPGTINIPNKKKKLAGRVKVLASVVSAEWDLRYSLDDFTAAPMVEASDSNVKVTISGNLPVVNLDDLDISDDTKMLIIHGDDPDKPERFTGDRSKAVWRVICELVRAEASNDMIAAILLNKDLGISAHILEHTQSKSYLIRQIKKVRRTVKEVGFPKIMEEAKKITPESGITKNDGQEPGVKPYASSIVASLVAAKATPVQVEAVFNTVKEQAPEKFTKKLLRNQYDDEKARAAKRKTAAEPPTHDKQLKELNNKHFVVTEAGKTRVLTEVFDNQVGRWLLERSSFEDIRNRYRNKTIIVGHDQHGNPVTERLGNWWLDHPERRQYESLVFAPGEDVADDTFNLWRGFEVEASAGDWSLYEKHIRENVCGGVEDHYDYLIRWMARCVQKPAVPGEVAVVLKGFKGTGKGVFANTFGGLFGQHYFAISNPKLLTGNFNAHLRDCVVLFCDEAFWAGDKAGQAQLQTTITEPHLSFESKGIDAVMGPNHTHIIMASNKDWVVPASAGERRYFVLDVGDERRNDHEYFKAIQDQMNNGGSSAMLHFLKNLDLESFQVRKVPQTDALARQKEESLTAEEKWFLVRLAGGRMLPWHDGWVTAEVPFDLLYDDYVKHAGITGERHKSHETKFGKAIKRLAGEKLRKLRNHHYYIPTRETDSATGERIMSKRTGTVYLLPGLEECRKTFEKVTGTNPDWDDDEEITF